MGNNPVGHFFEEEGNAAVDSIKGILQGASETLSGNFDYTNAKRDFQNYGLDVKNAFTGGSQRIADPADFQKEQLANYNRAINPQNSWNRQNWQTMAATGSNSVYGQSVGNNNVKPSDLLKISNSAVKMAVASSTGAGRKALVMAGSNLDKSMANTLSLGNQSASNTINSGGGTGAPIPADSDPSKFKEPNTEPIGSGQAASTPATPDVDISAQSAPDPSTRN